MSWSCSSSNKYTIKWCHHPSLFEWKGKISTTNGEHQERYRRNSSIYLALKKCRLERVEIFRKIPYDTTHSIVLQYQHTVLVSFKYFRKHFNWGNGIQIRNTTALRSLNYLSRQQALEQCVSNTNQNTTNYNPLTRAAEGGATARQCSSTSKKTCQTTPLYPQHKTVYDKLKL